MSDMNDFPVSPEPAMGAVPEILDVPVMPPPQKSKTTTWIIIAVLIIILLCCCCVGFVIFGFSQMVNQIKLEDILNQLTYLVLAG